MAHRSHHGGHRYISRVLVAYRRLVLVINERPACFQGQSEKEFNSLLTQLSFFELPWASLFKQRKWFFFSVFPFLSSYFFNGSNGIVNGKLKKK